MGGKKRRARQTLLAFHMGWGGRRPGSGREPKGARAGVAHEKKPALSARHGVQVSMRLRGRGYSRAAGAASA
jgi:hypothetical protein